MSVAVAIDGLRRSVQTDHLQVSMSASASMTISGSVYIPGATWRPSIGDEIALWSEPRTIGGARSFNGTSSVLSRAFSSGTTDNWTIGIWARANTTGTQRFAFIVGDANDGYGLYVTSTGYWQGVLSGLLSLGGTAEAVATGVWTLLVMRRASGTTQLFVNGVAVGSTSATAPTAPNGYISVGARRNTGDTAFEQFWDGDLAHAFLFHDDLTNTQIGQLASGGPAGTARALDAIATGTYWYYPMGGDASPEPDTAASTSLTVTSAPQTTDGPLVIASDADTFAGAFTSLLEAGALDQPTDLLRIDFTASGFDGLLDRAVVTTALSAQSLTDRLADLRSTFVPAIDTTIASDQPTGPTVAARPFALRTVADHVRELIDETGYTPRVDEFKVWSMRLPSAVAAPFDIDEASRDAIGDITVQIQLVSPYVNLLHTYFGTGTRAHVDTFTGDGISASFSLTMAFDSLVPVGSDLLVNVNSGTYETLTVDTAGGQWELDTSAGTLTRAAGALTNGHTAALTYNARFPRAATQLDDAAAWSTVGVHAGFLSLPDTFTKAEADDQAEAYFTRVSKLPRIVTYATKRAGLRPGQLQHIEIPDRDLDADFTITQVEVSTSGPNAFIYTVTASDDGVVSDWRDAWRRLAA